MHPEAPRTIGTATASSEAEDAALMDRIARHRDREAFATLFNRHKQAAFNLARHMTRDADEAEEAVQEGMLRAWSAAPSFRPQGSVRGWVLKIVVRECLRIRRERTSERNRIMRKREIEMQESPKRASAEPEQVEILRALHDHVMTLDETSRQLLALYYGASMSQEEIGETLAIPQTSVSRRIRDLLKDCRTHLAAAGFAAAVPMMDSQLGHVLCAWEEAPASLGSHLLTRLGRESMRYSRRLIPGKTSSLSWIWIAATATVLAAGGGYLAFTRHAPAERPPATAQAASAQLWQDTGTLVYDSHFDGASLDTFWSTVPPLAAWQTPRPLTDPPGKALFQPGPRAPTGVGQDRSYLRLQAWGTAVEGDAGERLDGVSPDALAQRTWRPAAPQTVEIVSQPFDMGQKPLHFHFDTDPPYGEGRFEYGIETIDQDGRSCYKQGYRAERRGTGYYIEDFLVLNGQTTATDFKPGVMVAPPALDIRGAFHTSPVATTPSKQQHKNVVTDFEQLDSLRLRLYVTAQVGAKVTWPIDHLVLSRIAIPEPDLHRVWSFESGPAGLGEAPGIWEWTPLKNGQGGGMQAGSKNEKSPWLALPVRLPLRPVIIRAKVMLPSGQSQAYFDSFWNISSTTVKYRFWKSTPDIEHERWYELVHYYFDRYVVSTFNRRPVSVRETDIAYPSPRAYVSFRGLLVRELECRTIAPEEIPEELRDPAQLAKSMPIGPLPYVQNKIEPIGEAGE